MTLPTTEKKLTQLKSDIQELLAVAAPGLIASYVTALNRPGNELEDLRKGAEFIVKTLGISAEKDSNAGLPVFNFMIGNGVTPPATMHVAVPEEALPVVEDAVVLPVAVPAPAPTSKAPPDVLQPAEAHEPPKAAEAPPELATTEQDDPTTTLLVLGPEDADEALAELLGSMPEELLNTEFELPLED